MLEVQTLRMEEMKARLGEIEGQEHMVGLYIWNNVMQKGGGEHYIYTVHVYTCICTQNCISG